MEKYSKRMIVIHWLTLLLVVIGIFLGFALDDARHAGKATLAGYVAHALIGNTVLLLALVRLYFRRKDGVPPPLGQTLMDKVAKGIHHTLYTVLILLPISGIITIATSDIVKAISADDASLLPKKFEGVLAHNVHEVLVTVLLLLVAVHILGALKHHFVLKDGIMDRMSLRGKK